MRIHKGKARRSLAWRTCLEFSSCRGFAIGKTNSFSDLPRTCTIDELFTVPVDWNLIATMLPDMLRVAVSIRTGAILPSDILRRLNSSSRKNKLYFGLRELGRVVRTMFLLRYLSDAELRRVIQVATNKSARFNQFVQWVSFGGDSIIAENTRDEQRKFIKYNHLVANLLVFHNLVTLTKAVHRLQQLKKSPSARYMILIEKRRLDGL